MVPVCVCVLCDCVCAHDSAYYQQYESVFMAVKAAITSIFILTLD